MVTKLETFQSKVILKCKNGIIGIIGASSTGGKQLAKQTLGKTIEIMMGNISIMRAILEGIFCYTSPLPPKKERERDFGIMFGK